MHLSSNASINSCTRLHCVKAFAILYDAGESLYFVILLLFLVPPPIPLPCLSFVLVADSSFISTRHAPDDDDDDELQEISQNRHVFVRPATLRIFSPYLDNTPDTKFAGLLDSGCLRYSRGQATQCPLGVSQVYPRCVRRSIFLTFVVFPMRVPA